MRSPAAAIAWEFRQRYWWGFAAAALYLAVLVTIRLLFFEPARVIFDDDQSFAFMVIVPLSSIVIYLLAVFSFGLAGDLAAHESIYPARLFTLPVTNAALVGWPMLYGTVAVALLWLATRLLGVWPPDVYVPSIWPALALAVFLAWTQVLTWMPFPLPGLRVIFIVGWLGVMGIGSQLVLEFEVPERVMLGFLAPQVPLAYFAARVVVARARRGDTPDWRDAFARLERFRGLFSLRRDHFSSPERAQAWFEWRRHGRSLPLLVAMVLPFGLALLWVFRDTPELVFDTLAVVLLTPPIMAAFVAANVSRSSADGSDSYEMTPFMATRPLSSTSLVAAKLAATIRSTVVTWLLVLVAVLLALRLSGASSAVADGALDVIESAGMPRTVALVLLGLSALVASTWKQLVRSLYVGMSGRAWLVKASVFVTLVVLTVIVSLLPWVHGSVDVVLWLWRVLPWVLAVLICVKVSGAVWAAMRLQDNRLLKGRTLVSLPVRPAGLSSCWRSTRYSCGSSMCRRPWPATVSDSSRSWPFHGCDYRRHRWPLHGIDIGDHDGTRGRRIYVSSQA